MNKNFLRVQDHPDLVREKNSKAILNNSESELNKYKQIRDEKLKLKTLMVRQETIESEILEIKSLLKQLLERSGS